MTRLWLPELDANAQLGNNADESIGKFIETDLDAISSISENLILSSLQDPSDLRSIPNIWARVMAYQLVLLESHVKAEATSPFASRVISEWRGLLAAVVLRQHYRLNLTVHPLGQADGAFMQAAWSLLPNVTAYHEDSWEDMALICLQKADDPAQVVPIGLTSPNSMICASADTTLPVPVPWYQNNGFYDPLSDVYGNMHLSTADRVVLACWLSFMIEQLKNRRNADDNLATALKAALQTYLSDLLKVYPVKFNKPSSSLPQTEWPVSFMQSRQANPSTSFLLAEYQLNIKKNDLLIQTSGENLIVTRNGMDDDTLIYSIYDYSDFKRNPDLVRRSVSQSMQSCSILDSGDLFLPKMAYLNSDEDLPDSIQNKGMQSETPLVHRRFKRDGLLKERAQQLTISPLKSNRNRASAYIIPITEQAFALVADPAKQIRIINNENTYAVEIDLQLANGNTLTVHKHYELEDIEEITSLPTAAIWPREHIEGWSKYYVFLSPVEGSDGYRYSLVDQANKENRIYFNKKESSVPALEYWATKQYPRALRLLQQERHAGYLLVDEQEAKSRGDSGEQICYGIDFGTSACTVYWRRQNMSNEFMTEPAPVDLAVSLGLITCDQSNISHLIEFFMSPFNLVMQFPTVVHAMSTVVDKPLLESSIFFYGSLEMSRNMGLYQSKQDRLGIGEYKSNVKWKDNDKEKSLAKSVIKQICMMLALHATLQRVSHVRWIFTYPLSLPDVEIFKRICKESATDAEKDFSLYRGEEENHITCISESEATARYFIVHKKIQRNDLVVIDIGGGSTDLLVYLTQPGGVQCIETSIPIGARKFLIDALFENQSYLTKILREVMRQEQLADPFSVSDQIIADKEEYSMYIERLLTYSMPSSGIESNSFGDLISRHIVTYSKDNNANRLLRTIIALYLSAIFYYCGLLIRSVANHAVQEGSQPLLVYIGIAGNGSKILDWIRTSIFSETNDIKVFDSFIEEGSRSTSGSVSTVIGRTEKPKTEAATGMLSDSIPGQKNSSLQIDKVFIPGIAFVTKDIAYNDAAVNLLDQESYYVENFTKLASLDEVERFLAVYNRKADDLGSLRVDLAASPAASPDNRLIQPIIQHILKDELDRRLSDRMATSASGTKKQFVDHEPFFMTAVRTIVDKYIINSAWKQAGH